MPHSPVFMHIFNLCEGIQYCEAEAETMWGKCLPAHTHASLLSLSLEWCGYEISSLESSLAAFSLLWQPMQ